jgi:hypothetical protein
MTSNDEQIDLLMRRHARSAQRMTTTDHLDPDEMNTFAEGALPPVARARYVSHLADCDQCRQQVAQLALSAGAVLRTEQSVPEKPASRSVWQVFGGWFALPVLRYAAFAAALLIVAGVAFITLRPRSEESLVAGNGPLEQHPASAVKSSAPDSNSTSQTNASPARTGAASDQNPKRDETRVAENISPPQPAKEAPLPSASIESKAGESQAYKMSPSYAPPPPGESQAAVQEQRSVAGTASAQKKAEAADKMAAADRERDATKDAGRADETTRIATTNQPAPMARRAADDKQKGGPGRNVDNLSMNRNQVELRSEPPKTQTGADNKTSTEELSGTRSVNGHKFRRQGNSWVDQKFKSSMAMKSISRGSDEFKALDSGVRSIAQQFSGEVIVVWKRRAYLIK